MSGKHHVVEVAHADVVRFFMTEKPERRVAVVDCGIFSLDEDLPDGTDDTVTLVLGTEVIRGRTVGLALLIEPERLSPEQAAS